jgi:hypothetical protein
MRLRVPDIVRWLVIAALAGMAWASAMETIELDGYRATFDPEQDFLVTEGVLDCSAVGGPAAVPVTETAGRLGEADYLVFQPADWNGDLVLFGHAAESPFPPAGRFWFPLPLGFGPETTDMPFALFRDAALCQGFAWAAPASERYGAAIAELMRSTHLLGALAARHLGGAPARTFVTGYFAPGGLAALALAETYPHRYAGAIVVNAPVGGTRLWFDHVMHVAALFDVFFPDLVAFERERGMTPPEFGAFGGALQQRAMADPSALQRMASIHLPGSERFDPAGVGHNVLWGDPTAPDAQAAFMSLGEALVYGGMWYHLVLGEDLRTRGGGGIPSGNQHVLYRGEGWSVEEIVDLNARVPRYASDPLAERYWTLHYEPSGALEIPLVAIRGPSAQVPSHYWAYADRLNRAGGADLYSEWAIPTHEQEDLRQNSAAALRALVAWIETGTRPAWPPNP